VGKPTDLPQKKKRGDIEDREWNLVGKKQGGTKVASTRLLQLIP
jgi:hypothetical protein